MAAKKGTRTSVDRTVADAARRDRTYSQIIDRAIRAVREEKGLRRKISGLTEELVALGAHTKAQFNALTLVQKLLTALLLMVVGAGATVGAYFLLRPGADELRAAIRAHVAAKEWLAAKEDLERLRTVHGPFGEEDRFLLANPVQQGMQARASELFAQVAQAKKERRWEGALAAVDELEALGVETRRTIYAHAEVLRLAQRHQAAAEQYARYLRLFPDTEESDDAMFWQALMLKEQGRRAEAKAMLQALVKEYPSSNYLTSTGRLLAELESAQER